MGSFGSVSEKSKNKIQVWYLNKDKKIQVSSSLTLKDLKTHLNNIDPEKKDILLDWVSVNNQDQNFTLEKVIQNRSASSISSDDQKNVFMVIHSFDESKNLQSQSSRQQRLTNKLKDVQCVQLGKTPNYERGKNGNIVFEDRHTAIFASAVSYALWNTSQSQDKLQKLLTKVDKKSSEKQNLSTIGQFLSYLGLMKQQNTDFLTSQNLTQKLQALKSSTDFSDFDPKFIYYIAQIYLKFMIKSKNQIYYIDYKKIQDFEIQSISSKSKIGIIGDFGTGLKDSIELLSNMVLKHGVDVIFHLGDVYYAGTPQEYLVGITEPLKKLRLETKRQIRFYSIPGNHDYYSWGLPFLCFVKSINEKQFHQQKASYFCVRDEKYNWQFLGMDTSFHDSNPLNQIDPYGVGPLFQEKELKWHKNRLEKFDGSTILMTHHPLFSIHERINGQLTKYRKFSCINPMLCAQMFEHMPEISGWFWGHEHSLMFFEQNLFGLSKGRLLGNSSFHVMYGKEHPYSRPKGFPKIPFIVKDEEYFDQYLPLNPNLVQEDYFGLSYAIIDLGKMDKDTKNLVVEYWCSPSYSNEQHDSLKSLSAEEQAKIYFNQYKIYEETIYSRESLKKHRCLIKNHSKVYLRSDVGLALDLVDQKNKQIFETHKQNSLVLNLSAAPFHIEFIHEKSHEDHQDNELEFTLKHSAPNFSKQLYLGVINQKVQLIEVVQKEEIFKNNCIWITQTIKPQKTTDFKCVYLYYGQPIKIYNKRLEKCLSWEISKDETYPSLEPIKDIKSQSQDEILENLWLFEMHNLISK